MAVYLLGHIKNRKVTAPEYGGNGKTEAKDTTYIKPVVGFPGILL